MPLKMLNSTSVFGFAAKYCNHLLYRAHVQCRLGTEINRARVELVNLLTVLFDHLPILKIDNEIFHSVSIQMYASKRVQSNTHTTILHFGSG